VSSKSKRCTAVNPETELRKRLIKALAPEIAVESVESGAVNPGFPDVLLAVPGADGLFPVELKVGTLVGKGLMETRIVIKYRADQNAKNAELRRRIRNVWTLVGVEGRYYVLRDYAQDWRVVDLDGVSIIWYGTDLGVFKLFLLDRVKRH
jgi:hypothetical protein